MIMLNDNPYLCERDELLAHLVDDGTISAEAARRERCRQRGICSEPDCEQAIDGWCAGCGAKLCAKCLSLHAQDGCEDAHAAAMARDEAEQQAMTSERCEQCGGSGWMSAEDWESGYHVRWKTQCTSCHGRGVAHSMSEQRSGDDGA